PARGSRVSTASQSGQRNSHAQPKKTRGNARASPSARSPKPSSGQGLPARSPRNSGSPGFDSAKNPSRTAGSTVANETAPKNAPTHGLSGSPVYHQFFSRRLSSSNKSQNSTDSAAQAKSSRNDANAER